jgi:ubiquinone/menaquinone biosynthesis C-methylase UbiE
VTATKGERQDRASERARIVSEYERRDARHDQRYDAEAPAVRLERAKRRKVAEALLRQAGVFPGAESATLEIGCGVIGWGRELLEWGVQPSRMHGIDLSPSRIDRARSNLPGVDFRVGDATALPWEPASFDLVIASTVLTSILDGEVRRLVADEIVRVMAPGGALLWYDFAFDNPRNRHVRKVDRPELQGLFAPLGGEVRSLTLAPPLARLVSPVSSWLAAALGEIPLLQTHLLAVLVKNR